MASHAEKVAAMHRAHNAALEHHTPGLRPIMPQPNETYAQERSRLALQVDRLSEIRSRAMWRMLSVRLAPVQAERRGGYHVSQDHLCLWFASHEAAQRAVILLTGTVTGIKVAPGDPAARVPHATLKGTLSANGPHMLGTDEPDPVGDFLRAERDAFAGAMLGALPLAAE